MSRVHISMSRSSRAGIRAATIWAVIFSVGVGLLGLGAAAAGAGHGVAPPSPTPTVVAYFTLQIGVQGNPDEVALQDHSYVLLDPQPGPNARTNVTLYITNITVDWTYASGWDSYSYLAPGEHIHHAYDQVPTNYLIKETVTAVIPYDGGFVTSVSSTTSACAIGSQPTT